MSDVAKNFITHFHNLTGGTVKEKHQNLFNLLHQNISLKQNPEDLDYITANLKPGNHLEKIFLIDFLVYFQRFNELNKTFKDGDRITIRKVSKQAWFFENVFKEIDVEEFVDKILPTTSHSMKLKILKKLPINGQQADNFFDALYKRYGIFLATSLLLKCTSNKISEILKTHPIKLTVVQLQNLYEKDPDLIGVYFEERTKHEGGSNFINHNPILKFLAQKNPDLFSKLFNKYQFETALGRRTTKKYIDSQKADILNKPEAYFNILNKSATVRRLGPEIKERNLLFNNSSATHDWKALLKHYPKKRQFEVYRCAYDSVYHHKFGLNSETITEDVLEVMEDDDVREEFAIKKIEKEDNDNYLKYVKPDYCLKKFMEKVSYMKTAERARYVGIATYCCLLNKDVKNLLKVCELVCIRFKNDERAVREAFFRTFSGKMQLIDDFSEQHWKFVMDIIAVSKAKNEWVLNEQEIRLRYLKYLIINNKDIKGTIQKYSDWYEATSYNETGKEPKVLKPIVTELLESGFTKTVPSHDKLEVARCDCRLAAMCRNYNDRNPKDIVTVLNHPRILNSIEKVLTEETELYVDRSCVEGVQYIICQPSTSQELKKLYFKSFKKFGDISALMWFLKHEPKTLQDNFDQFLEFFPEVWGANPKRLWRFIQKYCYLEFDRRTIEFCRLKMNEEGYEHKEKLVRALSMLSPPASHLEFIQQYAPISDKVDLADDEVKELYKIQGKLMKLLHYVNDPPKVLPVALDFCKGDYLQFALSPLYSSIYNIPENDTKPFIDKLDERKALSVKKHAMNLTCVIYDEDTIYTCLKNAEVPSLLATLKYFVKNPSKELWELIETKISNLTMKDLQALKEAVNLNIPFEYKSRFVEVVWNVLDKYQNKELKKILLTKINDDTIHNFQSEFAIKIIQNNIFKLEEANDFVSNLLIHSSCEEKFEVFSKTLFEFKTNFWNSKEEQRKVRRQLHKFILSLFSKYMKLKEPKPKFASELSTVFKSVFSPTEAFEESVLISCMSLKGETIENCSKILMGLNNSFGKDYGSFLVALFASIINKYVLKEIFTTDAKKIKLCHSLVKGKESVNDYLLAIKLLPAKQPEDVEHFTLYEDITNALTQVTDPVVQLQFSLYLKLNSN